jgi:hypothetical protein
LEAQVFRLQQENKEATLGRRSEGSALLQLEHLKADNERLIEMLGQTDKFADFGQFAKDSGSMMTYLADPEAPRTKCHYPKVKNQVRDIRSEEEVEGWIPEEAFRVAHDFRAKNGDKIPKTLINQLL